MINHHKEVSIVRSSAAEYLTFIATVGKSETSVEMRYEDENIWLTHKMMATLYNLLITVLDLKEIQQTQPVTSCDVIANAPQTLRIFSATLAGSFSLGWTHYVALLTISNADERRFYEIEARENSWGARELERQIAASLYERLALSRDKEGIRQLSQKGLVVEKPGDVIKNPIVLEFLDLEEKSAYSEHALETAISICLMSNNLSLRLSRTKF